MYELIDPTMNNIIQYKNYNKFLLSSENNKIYDNIISKFNLNNIENLNNNKPINDNDINYQIKQHYTIPFLDKKIIKFLSPLKEKYPNLLKYINELIDLFFNSMIYLLIVFTIIKRDKKLFLVLLFTFIVFLFVKIIKVSLIPFKDNIYVKRPFNKKCFDNNNIIFNNFFKLINFIPEKKYPDIFFIGLPSSHTIIYTSFFSSLYFLYPKYRKKILIISIIFLLLITVNRIMIYCHNSFQIFISIILGIIIPFFLHKFL